MASTKLNNINTTVTTHLMSRLVNTTFLNSTTQLSAITQGYSYSSFERGGFKIIMSILYGVIFMIGVPGNTLVIMTIIRVPKMRTVKNIFLANLAIGDLVNILWCLTTSLVTLYVSWPYGEAVCKYIFPITDVIIANTIFSMVAITVDRYRAICYPLSTRLSLRRTVIVIVISWVMSYCLVGLPLVYATQVSRGYWVEKSCNLMWSRLHEIGYRVFSFVCLFCLPFGIVLFCFVRIRNQLKENIKFATASVRGRETLHRAKRHQRLITLLLIIFLCFTICFLPINILLVTITFYLQLYRWKYAGVVFQMAIALFFSHSFMNPIILYLLSNDWKVAYHMQIKCLCPNSSYILRMLRTVHPRTFSELSVSEYNNNESRTASFTTCQRQRSSTAATTGSDGTISTIDSDRSCLTIDQTERRKSILSVNYEDSYASSLLLPRNGSLKRKKSVTWSKNTADGSDQVIIENSDEICDEFN